MGAGEALPQFCILNFAFKNAPTPTVARHRRRRGNIMKIMNYEFGIMNYSKPTVHLYNYSTFT